MLGQVRDHLIAAGQPALDLLLDGQSGPFAVEGENLIDGVKQFLRFARRDLDFFFRFLRRRSFRSASVVPGRFLILCGWDTLVRLLLTLILTLILLPLRLRNLSLRRCRTAPLHKQHNHQKRHQKPLAKQFNDIH